MEEPLSSPSAPSWASASRKEFRSLLHLAGPVMCFPKASSLKAYLLYDFIIGKKTPRTLLIIFRLCQNPSDIIQFKQFILNEVRSSEEERSLFFPAYNVINCLRMQKAIIVHLIQQRLLHSFILLMVTALRC